MKLNSTKLFSILLAVSWFVVLFFLLYPFLKHDAPPDLWLLLVLAVLPLFMLIQKLKIGSFLDFSKSDSPPHHTATTIGQQINLPVMGRDAAKAMAELISRSLEQQKERLTSSSRTKYSGYNRLEYSIDMVLINSLPTLISYYSFVTTTIRNCPSSTTDDQLKKPIHMLATIPLSPEEEIDYSSLLVLISAIQANINSVLGSSAEELSLHFTNIQRLIELRTSAATPHDQLKLTAENFHILLEGIKSASTLLGFMGGNWAGLRHSITSLLSTTKPTRDLGDKH